MACIHNQKKIDDLNEQITNMKNQIIDLKDNITKCEDIKTKHYNFNQQINCVIKNLVGNTVVAGVSYDEGKMFR